MAGVVETTNTFATNDVITSTAMNNIIDQTLFTSDAIASGNTTLALVSGKMKVGTITSNEMGTAAVTANALASDAVTTVKILDSNVTTAKIADANVTQEKLAANVVGNGPAFSAYSNANQTINNGVETKVTLGTESFDTNSNFAASRFTPSVAGFYFICGSVGMTDNTTELLTVKIYKNGSEYVSGTRVAGGVNSSIVSTVIQMNGTTDYVELYARQATSGGVSKTISGASNITFMSGCLIRSA
jgi:hypothetical protein